MPVPPGDLRATVPPFSKKEGLMSAVELRSRGDQRFAALVVEARQRHAAVVAHERLSLAEAMACGDALRVAKDIVPSRTSRSRP
jgi:hypothetical protein